MRMRQVEPRLPLVALTNGDVLQIGRPEASPWLGGIEIADFGGNLVAGVHSFDADALSPVHGNPQYGKVGDPDYAPYTTPALVAAAHRAGIPVVSWTIDDPAAMASLVDAGVDGLITDYPDRPRPTSSTWASARSSRPPAAASTPSTPRRRTAVVSSGKG